MVKFKCCVAIAILLFGGGFAGTARAGAIVQSENFQFSSGYGVFSYVSTLTSPFSKSAYQAIPFTLSKFDPSLGTLNSIKLDVSWTGDAVHSLTLGSFVASGAYAGGAQAQANGQSRVSFRADGLNDTFTSTQASAFPTASSTSPVVELKILDMAGGGITTISNAGFLGLFQGPGVIPSLMRVDNYAGVQVDYGLPWVSVTGCNPTYGPCIGGTLTLTYDFTAPAAVPEPGTLAIFGLGLAGLGFARRRKAA